MRFEFSFMGTDAPCNSGIFVGQGDGGFVLALSLTKAISPVFQRVQFSFGTTLCIDPA